MKARLQKISARMLNVLGTEISGAPRIGETYNAEAPLRNFGSLLEWI